MSSKSLQLFDTEHPVAFVTGSAADRVGRQIARLLLDNGYCVAHHSHRDDKGSRQYVESLQAEGRQAMICVGAVEEESNVRSWLQQIGDRFGRIDAVVNSAAIWEPKPLEQTTADDVHRNLQVNAVGSFLVAQHFGLEMVKQATGGAIVQIGDWAVQRPYVDFAAYFMGKGLVETMTRSLAVELATRNPRVRVNAVLPGPVMMASEISAERHQAIIDQCLLRRAGTAMDVAEAAMFLLSSPFITGVCLPVDGGRTIYSGPGTDRHAHPKVKFQ
jgi:pteridine reductase